MPFPCVIVLPGSTRRETRCCVEFGHASIFQGAIGPREGDKVSVLELYGCGTCCHLEVSSLTTQPFLVNTTRTQQVRPAVRPKREVGVPIKPTNVEHSKWRASKPDVPPLSNPPRTISQVFGFLGRSLVGDPCLLPSRKKTHLVVDLEASQIHQAGKFEGHRLKRFLTERQERTSGRCSGMHVANERRRHCSGFGDNGPLGMISTGSSCLYQVMTWLFPAICRPF